MTHCGAWVGDSGTARPVLAAVLLAAAMALAYAGIRRQFPAGAAASRSGRHGTLHAVAQQGSATVVVGGRLIGGGGIDAGW